jgi:hypothetical protein
MSEPEDVVGDLHGTRETPALVAMVFVVEVPAAKLSRIFLYPQSSKQDALFRFTLLDSIIKRR